MIFKKNPLNLYIITPFFIIAYNILNIVMNKLNLKIFKLIIIKSVLEIEVFRYVFNPLLKLISTQRKNEQPCIFPNLFSLSEFIDLYTKEYQRDISVVSKVVQDAGFCGSLMACPSSKVTINRGGLFKVVQEVLQIILKHIDNDQKLG